MECLELVRKCDSDATPLPEEEGFLPAILASAFGFIELKCQKGGSRAALLRFGGIDLLVGVSRAG
jgi:hypothetical protein